MISSQLIVKICRAGISNGSQGGDNTGVRKEGAVPAILPPIPLPPSSSEPCPPRHRSRASTPLYTLPRAPPNLSTTPPLSTLLSLCLVRFFIVVCFLPLCTALLLQPKPTREPAPSTPRSPTPSSSSVLPPLPLVLTGFPLSLLHLSFQSFLLLPQDGKARGEKAVGVWCGMSRRATGGPGVGIKGGGRRDAEDCGGEGAGKRDFYKPRTEAIHPSVGCLILSLGSTVLAFLSRHPPPGLSMSHSRASPEYPDVLVDALHGVGLVCLDQLECARR